MHRYVWGGRVCCCVSPNLTKKQRSTKFLEEVLRIQIFSCKNQGGSVRDLMPKLSCRVKFHWTIRRLWTKCQPAATSEIPEQSVGNVSNFCEENARPIPEPELTSWAFLHQPHYHSGWLCYCLSVSPFFVITSLLSLRHLIASSFFHLIFYQKLLTERNKNGQ